MPTDTKRRRWAKKPCLHCQELRWTITHGLCRWGSAVPALLERYPKLTRRGGLSHKPSLCHPDRLAKTGSGQCAPCHEFERRQRLRVCAPGCEKRCSQCGLFFKNLRAGGRCWRCTLPPTDPTRIGLRHALQRAASIITRDVPMELWYAIANGCGPGS